MSIKVEHQPARSWQFPSKYGFSHPNAHGAVASTSALSSDNFEARPTKQQRLTVSSTESELSKLSLNQTPQKSDPALELKTGKRILEITLQSQLCLPPVDIPHSFESARSATLGLTKTSNESLDWLLDQLERNCGRYLNQLSAAWDGTVLGFLGSFVTMRKQFTLANDILSPFDRIRKVRREPDVMTICYSTFSRMFEGESLAILTSGINQMLQDIRSGVIPAELADTHEQHLEFIVDILDKYFIWEYQPVLDATNDYFAAKHDEKWSSPDYIISIEAWLEQERKRACWQRHNFVEEMETVMRQALFDNNAKSIFSHHLARMIPLDGGLTKQFTETEFSELSLLSDFAGKPLSREVFPAHVFSIVKSLVTDSSKDSSMISSLLMMRRTEDQLISKVFGNDPEVAKLTSASFGQAMTQRSNKPAEMFVSAKYIDKHMKRGTFSTAELQRMISLFRVIKDKDIFQEFYARDLLRRALQDRSASSDTEMELIAMFKHECGEEFTSRLEHLYTELETSSSIFATFSAQSKPQILDGVSIIRAGSWEKLPETKLSLPDQFSGPLKDFSDWYSSQTSNRILLYRHSHSTVVITANFASSNTQKDLVMTLPQGIILLLFEDLKETEFLTVQQIQEQSGLNKTDLDRCLVGLLVPGQNVLKKKPAVSKVELSDKVIFNDKFSCNTRKVLFHQVASAIEDANTTQAVERDRDMEYQSAAVRILKARKIISHQDLLHEIISVVTARHAVGDGAKLVKHIKGKIFNFLLENDYMERDESDSAMYKYIA